jgi:hypothetical protein
MVVVNIIRSKDFKSIKRIVLDDLMLDSLVISSDSKYLLISGGYFFTNKTYKVSLNTGKVDSHISQYNDDLRILSSRYSLATSKYIYRTHTNTDMNSDFKEITSDISLSKTDMYNISKTYPLNIIRGKHIATINGNDHVICIAASDNQYSGKYSINNIVNDIQQSNIFTESAIAPIISNDCKYYMSFYYGSNDGGKNKIVIISVNENKQLPAN